MYSILSENDIGEHCQKSTAKGIKSHLKKQLLHERYQKCFHQNEESPMLEYYSIRSKYGKLYTLPEKKRGINTFNDKRFVINNKYSCVSLAFGHKDIPKYS